MAHFAYSDFLSKMGRREEALAEITRARDIEPFSAFLNAFSAPRLPDDAALERIRTAIDLQPDFYFAHMIAAGIYGRKKMYPEAIAESELAKKLSPDQTWSDTYLASLLMEAGKIDEASAILEEMLRLSKSRYVPPLHIALVYNALGQTDEALDWLEKGCKQHDSRMTFLKDPRLINLHGDPRFQEISRCIGFPPD